MPEEQNDVEDLTKQLEEAKKQAEEYLNGWKREKADFMNFQKENEARVESFVKFANRDLFMKILPILDGFNEALKYAPEEKDEFVKGMEQIKKQLDEFLKNNGVETMEVKAEFNPEFHEAIGFEEGEKHGEISRVAQAGYMLNGKVLRPAKVMIAK